MDKGARRRIHLRQITTEESAMTITTALGRYLHTIGKFKVLEKEEFNRLHRAYTAGDSSLEGVLISHNLRLVVMFARRYARSEEMMLDLIEEGNLGLIRAVQKFNPNEGSAFATYAGWWIRDHIENFLNLNERIAKIPLHMMKLKHSVSKLKSAADSLGLAFDVEAAAATLNVKVSSVVAALAILQPDASMDSPGTGGEKDGTYADSFSDDADTAEDLLVRASSARWLLKRVDSLPQKQREALTHVFGLNGQEPKSGEEVGRLMGLTRERVRQLVSDAKGRLARAAARDGLDVSDLLVAA